MNWSKIKSILIVVLLFTNIFLGYTFIVEKIRFDAELKNNIQDVIQLYRSKDVNIHYTNFNFPQTVQSVNITFDTYDIAFADLFLGTNYEFDGEKYIALDQFFSLSENRILYGNIKHYNRILQNDLSNLSSFKVTKDKSIQEKYHKLATAYLTSWGFDNQYDDFELRTLGKYQLVQLYQYSGKYRFDESKMYVWFYNEEIVGLSCENMVNISTNPGTKYDIITIDRVLYELLPQLNSGDTIHKISIVYKLNDKSLMVTDLVSGEALPYYQIVLKSGKAFYIRAVNYF